MTVSGNIPDIQLDKIAIPQQFPGMNNKNTIKISVLSIAWYSNPNKFFMSLQNNLNNLIMKS